ncbi:hypothetical protein J4212_03780 [Candidatus Woesearchaeota archaeon]|nr:hypothetical protein [Candidatus Woesearchaeota archaeon]
MAAKFWAMATMFFITFLTSTAQILWKIGSESLEFNIFSIITNYYLIVGLALYAIGAGMMILSFRGGDVSSLYPIIATSYVWVSIMSIWFLGEGMGFYKWAGVTVIVIGIVMIGYGSRESKAMAGAL